MRQVNLNESEIFLENIARKVWVHLDYAGAVENGLLEGSLVAYYKTPLRRFNKPRIGGEDR